MPRLLRFSYTPDPEKAKIVNLNLETKKLEINDLVIDIDEKNVESYDLIIKLLKANVKDRPQILIDAKVTKEFLESNLFEHEISIYNRGSTIIRRNDKFMVQYKFEGDRSEHYYDDDLGDIIPFVTVYNIKRLYGVDKHDKVYINTKLVEIENDYIEIPHDSEVCVEIQDWKKVPVLYFYTDTIYLKFASEVRTANINHNNTEVSRLHKKNRDLQYHVDVLRKKVAELEAQNSTSLNAVVKRDLQTITQVPLYDVDGKISAYVDIAK